MKTILLVEDSEGLRAFLSVFLAERGYTVVTVHDGLSALQWMREAPPDLVLLDMVLPALNGWELLDLMALEPALLAIPVVVISGYTRIDLPIPEDRVLAIFDKAQPLDDLLPVIDLATGTTRP